MPDISYGPVDYTSRDYNSIRDDLIKAAQVAIPEWNSADPNDYLRILLEAFAFVGDLNNYYIDRVANEANLATATQRQSLFNIARTFGYNPAGPLPASVDLLVTNKHPSAPVTIPAGTQFSGSYSNAGILTLSTFESTDQIISLAPNQTITINAVEGRTQRGSTGLQGNGQPIGVVLYRTDGRSTSDGSPSQTFPLPLSPVVDDSVSLWIHPAPGSDGVLPEGTRYTQFANLVDATSEDFAFMVIRNPDDTASILFGDGVSGYPPPSGYQVRAVYRVGGGATGNVQAGTINSVGATPDGSTLPPTIAVTQPFAARGGVDTESNASIRLNAPRALSTRDRAVSLADVEAIAVAKAGVISAKAIGSTLSNVVCYIAPSVASTDLQPGFDSVFLSVTSASLSGGTANLIVVDSPLAEGQIVNVYGIGVPYDGVWILGEDTNATTISYSLSGWADRASAPTPTGAVYAVTAETQSFSDLRSVTHSVLDAAVPAGTGVTVAAPVYTDLVIRVSAQLHASIRHSTARAAIRSTLIGRFSPMNAALGESISDHDVSSAIIDNVTGIRAVTVTSFERGRDYITPANSSVIYETNAVNLIGEAYEIFRLLPQNLSITLTGGIADVS